MKKARLILSAVVLFAIVGGALAFKANRFTPAKAFTLTHSYTIGSAVYSTTGLAYLPITGLNQPFFTTLGSVATTYYSTTGTFSPLPITLTQVGGTATVTFPAYTGVQVPNTFTTNVF